MSNFNIFIRKYLLQNPDAAGFVMCYVIYCHAIDDIIDGDKTDWQHILKTFSLAPILFSNVFYMQHYGKLYPLVKMAHDSYGDSVFMERRNSKCMKHYSDILRQNANEVILACVEIVNGPEVRLQASIELREGSYKMHHDEVGKPI